MSNKIQRTLIIVKPDAVQSGYAGKIIDRFIEEGLRVVAMKLTRLSSEQAAGFYYVHKGRPFFDELIEFMSSGPIIPAILEGDDAIAHVRRILGATDPAEAAPGTLRKLYAESKGRNAVHGSDAPETAAFETSYFFSQLEMVG